MALTADVCLLLEGTYPYVRGGVSSWVHEIVSGLPDRTFSIVFLGAQQAGLGARSYELPKNVVALEHAFLMEPQGPSPRRAAMRGDEGRFAAVELFHDHLRNAKLGPPPQKLIDAVLPGGAGQGITREEFLTAERSWEQIKTRYRESCTDPSFVDYFWTVRTMHAPLFTLGELAQRLPPAHSYHAVSTGYAGYLGTLLARRTRRPLVLTEHGIYTKERKIDLAHAEWIREPPGREGQGYLRELWGRFFEGLGRLAYGVARPIVSLYEGNRRRQIEDGADPARTRVVPNGIDVARFSPLRAQRPARAPPILGLLGRVVPIKDVRTFIRALRSVCDQLPEAEGWIIGPDTEDVAYARDCRELARSLGLSSKIKFLGFRKPEEILPQLGLLVMTSISEALPLVLLEAFASGLPAIATDVGACREILEGSTPADRALGPSGAVVPISDPEATARAALALLRDPARWAAAQRAGIERVDRFYTREQMLASYRALYEEAVGWRA